MRYLIDTNIVIDYLRGKEKVVKKVFSLVQEGFGLSTVSLAELYHGAQKSLKTKKNLEKIEQFIEIPELNLLMVDKGTAEVYGELMSNLEKSGMKLAEVDVLIAATAKYYGLTIITEDRKHFSRLPAFGIEVLLV